MRHPLFGLLMLLGGVVSLWDARPLAAQFVAPPGGKIQSVPTTPAQIPYVAPTVQRPVYSSFAPPVYGGTYVESRAGGYLNGVANVTSAVGQYQQDYQQGRLMNQEVERSKLATRKAWTEYQMWEQSLQPTAEDLRNQKMDLELRRAMNNPPLGEILSGDALNTLLRTVQDMQAKGGYGPTVPLDSEMLRHINVTTSPGMNIALFKDGGKLRWPFVLRDTPYDSDRQKVQDLVYKALKETESDELSPGTLRELKASVGRIEKAVDSQARDMSIQDSIQAHRYIDELNVAVKSLEHPSASKSLTSRQNPQGRTCAEMVVNMTKSGQRFSAALPGEEGPYRALHSALVAFSYGTMQTMRK